MIKELLSQMEAKLRTLIEGSAMRVFPDQGLHGRIADHLAAAMHAGIHTAASGERIAPNLYTLSIHAAHFRELQAHPEILEDMAWNLEKLAQESGVGFYSPPKIHMSEDTNATPNQVQVSAKVSIDSLEDTSDMPVEDQVSQTRPPDNAFIIVDGTRVVSLTRPVMNIGRRADNDISIDDRRVSRVHAQLRASNGHYLLFDLDSAGGTFVNDQRIIQSVLFPGDVISIAGVPLVYGQENANLGSTQKLIQSPEA